MYKNLSDSLKRNAEQLQKTPRSSSNKKTFLGSGFRKKTAKKRAIPERPTRKHLFTSENATKKDFQNKNENSILGYRLQKVLAAAGFGSRRECEELIISGRVEIDRKVVTELGVRVFPGNQEVRVDGETLKKTKPIYLALYKPKGYVCTHYDPEHRPRAVDLIPEKMGRVFLIGRLDIESEGLLLMTNDGALSERLTHPKYEVSKCYRVQVAGLIEPIIVQQLKKGIWLSEGHAKASHAVIKGTHKNSSIIEIELKEGKNREIRRLLARLGHKVLSLKRIAVGPVKLGKLLPGEYRLLTNSEVDKLYNAAKSLMKTS
ncbi:MAG: rRNA pseudouridine synthase [Planctomycetaceae bacterium]|nr:rRNA pseudouridine synthase [Planctomycetaceae bacterium]